MKIVFLLILISLGNITKLRACVCSEELENNKDSVFSLEYIYNNYPVVFVGEYIGWDYYNTRVFKVITRYKGLNKNVRFLTLNNETCNLHEKVGEQFLISAYYSKWDSVFMSFSNCNGSFRINDLINHNRLSFLEEQVTNNGLSPIDLDNRYIKGQKQILFNSVNYDFILQDENNIPINIENQLLEEHECKKVSNKKLIWYLILSLSVLFNIFLILKIKNIIKR